MNRRKFLRALTALPLFGTAAVLLPSLRSSPSPKRIGATEIRERQKAHAERLAELEIERQEKIINPPVMLRDENGLIPGRIA